ncbi:MAG TPA: monofunctional biosynthetic peptidoglycan transglycosylase [Gammaproteobacteria bacterium]
MRRLVLVCLFCVVLSVGAVLALRWVDPPVTAVMLLQPGPVGDVYYSWVDRDAIAWDAARAVIASEDQRFADHHGIDFVSLDRAIEAYADGDGLRGASTITQQVAKNLFLWQGRSFVRKALEAYFAVLLELFLTKERILEIYLNVAEFGPDVFGVEAAADSYFHTSASALDLDEAALLAAVLPNPQRLLVAKPSDYVRERQAQIESEVRLLESRGHYRGIHW